MLYCVQRARDQKALLLGPRTNGTRAVVIWHLNGFFFLGGGVRRADSGNNRLRRVQLSEQVRRLPSYEFAYATMTMLPALSPWAPPSAATRILLRTSSDPAHIPLHTPHAATRLLRRSPTLLRRPSYAHTTRSYCYAPTHSQRFHPYPPTPSAVLTTLAHACHAHSLPALPTISLSTPCTALLPGTLLRTPFRYTPH